MSDDRAEILETLKKVLVEQLDVDPDAVVEGASFIDDLGADSLAVVELVLAFEEGFGITIPDTEAEEMRTVGDAVTYILAHRGASGARAAS
jgi:acyl carrier protein